MNQHELTSEQLAKCQIRVFISSTFRDMPRDREWLVKQVFSELHRICEERFIAFKEADPIKTTRIFISSGHDEHASLAVCLTNELRKRRYGAWFDHSQEIEVCHA
jgi:hypothetical protein